MGKIGDREPELITLDEVERRHVERVLEACQGNRTIAATILGVDRKTLYRKLVRWGLSGSDVERATAGEGDGRSSAD